MVIPPVEPAAIDGPKFSQAPMLPCRWWINCWNCTDEGFARFIAIGTAAVCTVVWLTSVVLLVRVTRRRYHRRRGATSLGNRYISVEFIVLVLLAVTTRIVTNIFLLLDVVRNFAIRESLFEASHVLVYFAMVKYLYTIMSAAPRQDLYSVQANVDLGMRDALPPLIQLPPASSLRVMYRIYMAVVFPCLAVFTILSGHFRDIDRINVSQIFLRLHYITSSVGIGLTCCVGFAYYGKALVRLAERSLVVARNMKQEYGVRVRERLVKELQKSILRMKIMNMCAFSLFIYVTLFLLTFACIPELILGNLWVSRVWAFMATINSVTLVGGVMGILLFGDMRRRSVPTFERENNVLTTLSTEMASGTIGDSTFTILGRQTSRQHRAPLSSHAPKLPSFRFSGLNWLPATREGSDYDMAEMGITAEIEGTEEYGDDGGSEHVGEGPAKI